VLFRWKIEKKGFATVEQASFGDGILKFFLHEDGQTPAGMVYVEQDDSFGLDIPGFEVLPPVAMKDYWIDKYEVTNKQFKVFLDRGGYQKLEISSATTGAPSPGKKPWSCFVTAQAGPGPPNGS
jgi:hypothetical protein